MRINTPCLAMALALALSLALGTHWFAWYTAPAIDSGHTLAISEWLDPGATSRPECTREVESLRSSVRLVIARTHFAQAQQQALRAGANAVLVVIGLLLLGVLLERRRGGGHP